MVRERPRPAGCRYVALYALYPHCLANAALIAWAHSVSGGREGVVQLTGISRRTFLKSTAGVAAGAATVAALPGGVALASTTAAADGEATAASSEAAAATGPVIAYIEQGRRSEIRVMVGDREVVHRDPALVRRLLNAAK